MFQNSGPKILSPKLVHMKNNIFISRPDLYIYKTLVQNSTPKVWYFSWIDGEKLSGVDTPQSPCSFSRKHITARTFGIKIVSSPPPFIYWRNFAKIQNWTIEQLKMKWFFRVSIARSKGKKILQIFWIWVSIRRYRRMIQDFYLVSGLQPDLDKSSEGWSPLWLYQKIPNKSTCLSCWSKV
jgi:hypothetical protein